ncbi:hypothetical protein GCM10014713_39810 [Streptomyces purpureus]|uniref:Secreted protein n=2 Tax=Streptomyces purpureus TaxID=1951 RepID=A0A918LS93_9ACTN|nr:hypothetical protein GCM10014713_39810 [Streptomyces purpureus]
MLAVASLAAGVVTALVSPQQPASANETGTAGTGLLQPDTALGPLVTEATGGADLSGVPIPNSGPIV